MSGIQSAISVHGTTSPALDAHVQQKLGHALEPLSGHVHGVDVHLQDVNGISKAPGMRCHVTVRIRGEDPVVVEEVDGDMYEAISKAGTRVKNLMSKRHEKRLERQHGKL